MSLRPFIFTAVMVLGTSTLAQPPNMLPLLQAPPSLSETTPPSTPVSLAQALQAAGENLDTSLARRALDAAAADVSAADHAPAPLLSVKAASIDLQNGVGGGNVLSQKRIDKAVGLDWTYERGNKRQWRVDAAERTAQATRHDLSDTLLQQQVAAAGAYFDLLAAQDRLEQVSAMAHSASQLSRTAARRVKAGDLSAQDAARTDIESQRAYAEALAAQLECQRASLALGLLMGRTSPGPLTALPDWPALPPMQGGPEPTVFSLNEALLEGRADVKAARQRLEAAHAGLSLAEAQKKADVNVGASLDHYPGTSTRQLELRVQIPLYGVFGGYNFQGEIAKAQALHAQAQDALEKVLRLAGAELQRIQQDRQGAAARTFSYETRIVPQARQVADMAELAYSKGAMSLTDLIESRRTLRSTLLEALAARTDYAKAAASWRLRSLPSNLSAL